MLQDPPRHRAAIKRHKAGNRGASVSMWYLARRSSAVLCGYHFPLFQSLLHMKVLQRKGVPVSLSPLGPRGRGQM